MALIPCQTPILLVLMILTTAMTSNAFIIINGISASQVRVLGRLTCDIPPPPPPPGTEPILNGTNVALVCGGRGQSLAQAVTDVNGFFELVLENTLQSLFFNPSDCFVVVRLPIARCFIYPPTGILRGTLNAVSFLQPLFNAVAIITAGPLRLVT